MEAPRRTTEAKRVTKGRNQGRREAVIEERFAALSKGAGRASPHSACCLCSARAGAKRPASWGMCGCRRAGPRARPAGLSGPGQGGGQKEARPSVPAPKRRLPAGQQAGARARCASQSSACARASQRGRWAKVPSDVVVCGRTCHEGTSGRRRARSAPGALLCCSAPDSSPPVRPCTCVRTTQIQGDKPVPPRGGYQDALCSADQVYHFWLKCTPPRRHSD